MSQKLQSFQLSSVAQSCLILCDPIDCSTLGLPVHHQLPELTQTHVHWVGDAIQPSHPLSSPSPVPSIFPGIRVFSNDSVLHIRGPKYWSFSFSFSPSNEYSGLISFRMDWLDLLAVQGTLKSLLQHHSSKASIIRCRPLRCINIALYKFYSFSFSFIFLNSVWPYKKSILHKYPLRDQRVKTPALVPMYDNDDFKLTITGPQ